MSKRSYDMRYYSRVPHKLKANRILAHNHVRHTKDMPSGVNGFRFWTQRRESGWVRCNCGWQGVPHYCAKGDENRKCASGTWRQIEI